MFLYIYIIHNNQCCFGKLSHIKPVFLDVFKHVGGFPGGQMPSQYPGGQAPYSSQVLLLLPFKLSRGN